MTPIIRPNTIAMKTKQYVAFLQTHRGRACEDKTELPYVDRMTCVVEAHDAGKARRKLKALVKANCEGKRHFLGADYVALVSLVELPAIPTAGMVVGHEFGLRLPMCNVLADLPQAVKIRENARILWEQSEPCDYGSPEFLARMTKHFAKSSSVGASKSTRKSSPTATTSGSSSAA